MAINDRKSGGKPSGKKSDLVFGLHYASEESLEVSESSAGGASLAAADIYENSDYVFVDVEVPGIDPDNISVYLKEDRLTIQGYKSEEPSPSNVSFYCAERSFGPFKRVLVLGYTVDSDNISANCKNGILHLSIPKVKERRKKVHKIKVEIG